MAYRKLILIGLASTLGFIGCEANDGAAENAGEALDEAGEEMKDAGQDAANAVEDACEDAKEGVDAEDTDC